MGLLTLLKEMNKLSIINLGLGLSDINQERITKLKFFK